METTVWDRRSSVTSKSWTSTTKPKYSALRRWEPDSGACSPRQIIVMLMRYTGIRCQAGPKQLVLWKARSRLLSIKASNTCQAPFPSSCCVKMSAPVYNWKIPSKSMRNAWFCPLELIRRNWSPIAHLTGLIFKWDVESSPQRFAKQQQTWMTPRRKNSRTCLSLFWMTKWRKVAYTPGSASAIWLVQARPCLLHPTIK